MRYTVFLLFLIGNLAAAETSTELLNQLKVALKEAAPAEQTDHENSRNNYFGGFLEMLGQLDPGGSGRNGASELIPTVQRIEVQTASKKVRDLCHAFVKQWQDEQEKIKTGLIDELHRVLPEALRAGLAAKATQELDAPIEMVAKLAEKCKLTAGIDQQFSEISNQASQVLNLLQSLQNYQAGFDNGTRGPNSLLFLVTSGGTDFSVFIPRSELVIAVARFEEAYAKVPNRWLPAAEVDDRAKEIVANTHTLAEVGNTVSRLEALRAMNHTGLPPRYLNSAIQDLNYLLRLYLQVQQGLNPSQSLMQFNTSIPSDEDKALSDLRTQLISYALPRILQAADADGPQANERVADYLHRIGASARKRNDWPLLHRTVDLAGSLNIDPGNRETDQNALKLFFAGLNLEQARQFALAVNFYRAALKTGSEAIPSDYIGSHLESIQKDHPQDYEKGGQMPESSPVSPARPQIFSPISHPSAPQKPNTK